MTTVVAKKAVLAGKTEDEAVATALATTALATASLGVALVIVGKLKLARFVAYLPMPVVSSCFEPVAPLTSRSDAVLACLRDAVLACCKERNMMRRYRDLLLPDQLQQCGATDKSINEVPYLLALKSVPR